MRTITALCCLFVVGCMDVPCQNGSCVIGSPPVGVHDMIADIWKYYNTHNDQGMNAGNPPADDTFTWIALGNCHDPGLDDRPRNAFVTGGECDEGDTNIFYSPGLPPRVNFIYMMMDSETDGVVAHELLHAWLSLSGVVPDGDGHHKHPYWKTLLNDANQHIYEEARIRQTAHEAFQPPPPPAPPTLPPPTPPPPKGPLGPWPG